MRLAVDLGPRSLTSPLIAASGTVGSVVDFSDSIDFTLYGAAVAKSVSPEPWDGRQPPRIGPAGGGMLNGIGIQNPGIAAWIDMYADAIPLIPTQVWGSVVAHDVDGFAAVAAKMSQTDIAAIEVNLSCPNLDGEPFALDPERSAAVVRGVREATDLPIGAKLSPDARPVAEVAKAVVTAGADWLVVANTAMGAAIDPTTRRPVLSGLVGGYSGEAIRPLTMRCVLEVAAALPDVPLIACGGVARADHVVEYILAGATAVAIGTAHLARPRIAGAITRDLHRYGHKHKVEDISRLKGAFEPW